MNPMSSYKTIKLIVSLDPFEVGKNLKFSKKHNTNHLRNRQKKKFALLWFLAERLLDRFPKKQRKIIEYFNELKFKSMFNLKIEPSKKLTDISTISIQFILLKNQGFSTIFFNKH